MQGGCLSNAKIDFWSEWNIVRINMIVTSMRPKSILSLVFNELILKVLVILWKHGLVYHRYTLYPQNRHLVPLRSGFKILCSPIYISILNFENWQRKQEIFVTVQYAKNLEEFPNTASIQSLSTLLGIPVLFNTLANSKNFSNKFLFVLIQAFKIVILLQPTKIWRIVVWQFVFNTRQVTPFFDWYLMYCKSGEKPKNQSS